MKKSYIDTFAEQQRILILQFLNEDTDGKLNNALLQKALESFGHNITLDKVNTECAWLEDQGFVEVEKIGDGMSLVSITEAGLDIVMRRRVVPGIDRPIRGF